MKLLELMPLVARTLRLGPSPGFSVFLRFVCCRRSLDILRLIRRFITDSVQRRTRLAPADDKIHGAIGTEIEIGHVERASLQEHLGAPPETGPLRLEVHGK